MNVAAETGAHGAAYDVLIAVPNVSLSGLSRSADRYGLRGLKILLGRSQHITLVKKDWVQQLFWTCNYVPRASVAMVTDGVPQGTGTLYTPADLTVSKQSRLTDDNVLFSEFATATEEAAEAAFK